MLSTNRTVVVVARRPARLALLASNPSPLENACGAIGRIIAEKVHLGGGKALLPVDQIMPAIDTTDGVHAILDNFDLIDERTQSPLLHALMRECP